MPDVGFCCAGGAGVAAHAAAAPAVAAGPAGPGADGSGSPVAGPGTTAAVSRTRSLSSLADVDCQADAADDTVAITMAYAPQLLSLTSAVLGTSTCCFVCRWQVVVGRLAELTAVTAVRSTQRAMRHCTACKRAETKICAECFAVSFSVVRKSLFGHWQISHICD